MNALPVPHRYRSALAIGAQIVVAATGFSLLVLMPPAEGQIMLVPLTPAAARTLPVLAFRHGTRLVATGPLPGSLVVYGRRADLSGLLFRNATLALATPPSGCSAAAGAAAA
jgi:hypothetical protein